ncbi:MAG: DUF2111 domain-containing protein [Methanosarcinales archaeon]|nr:DUF2111 domain-containing protein [Methanosarcinales archaeon]
MTESDIILSPDSDSDDLASVAMAVHRLVGIPVTIRSVNRHGVCIEDEAIIDHDYTGPILEQVLRENKLVRTIPKTGKYRDIPVVVVPIRDKDEKAIAAIGVVDIIGSIDLGLVFQKYPEVIRQIGDIQAEKKKEAK